MKQVTLLEAILNGVNTLFQELYESGVEIAIKEGKNDLMQVFAFAGMKFERLLAMANPENSKDLDVESILNFTKSNDNSSATSPSTSLPPNTVSTPAVTTSSDILSDRAAFQRRNLDKTLDSYGEQEATCLINPENGFIPDFPQELIKEHEKELSFNSANNNLSTHRSGSGNNNDNNPNNSLALISNISARITQSHNQHNITSNHSFTSSIEDDFRQKLYFAKSELPAQFNFDTFQHQSMNDTLNETMFPKSQNKSPSLPVSARAPVVALPVAGLDDTVEKMKRDAIDLLTGKVKPAVPIEKLTHPISEQIFRQSLMYLLEHFVRGNVKQLDHIFSGEFDKFGLENLNKAMTALRLGISYNLSKWIGRVDDDNAFPGYLTPINIEKYYLKVTQSRQQLDERKFIDLVCRQARCLGSMPRISYADVQSAIVLSKVQ
ncbi:hypothetical protein DV453_004151 [Geotrichum candidum]|nr:hypothetical protein DV453_004151 [Geotrichum candidum]